MCATAGIMLCITFNELIPEAVSKSEPGSKRNAFAVLAALLLMHGTRIVTTATTGE